MGTALRQRLAARLGGWWRAATAPALFIVWGGWCLWVLLLWVQDIGMTRGFSPASLAVFEVDGEMVIAERGDSVCVALENEGWPHEIVWYGAEDHGIGFPFPLLINRVERMGISIAEPSRAAHVRAEAFRYLQRIGYRPDPRVRSEDVRALSIAWVGCGLNLLTLFAACAFVGSVRRLPELRVNKRAKLIAAGICPSCGYSIAGLPGPVCPECGERVG